MKFLKDTIAGLLVVLTITLNSCTPPEDKGQIIADSIVITYITGPEIQFPNSTGYIHLSFWIENTSDECIVFPFNFGAWILIEDGDSWIEVADVVQYLQKEDIHLEGAGSLFPDAVVTLRPDLSSVVLQESANVIAIITGHLCEDDSVIIEKQIPFVVKP